MADVFEISRKLIESAFKTYWEALTPSKPPIHWENVDFSQPADMTWLDFTIQFGSGVQASLGGNPREFQVGQVTVLVFTPKNSGSRLGVQLADFVAKGLRYRQLNESGVVVDMESPEIVTVGVRKDVYQTNVRVRFRAQHIAAVAA